MVDFSSWDILRNLLLAARWTVVLSLVALITGGLLGFMLLVVRLAKPKSVGQLVAGYVYLFQGTPLLMQIFLAYFGISLLGYDVSPWVSACLALTLYAGAFLTEIWKGCVIAIPKGQWEAAASQAMSLNDQLLHVILPQALRVAIAPTIGFVVQIVKATALSSVIGFVELTRAGVMISNAAYQPFLVYGLVALIYFALCYPISLWSRSLEKRLNARG